MCSAVEYLEYRIGDELSYRVWEECRTTICASDKVAIVILPPAEVSGPHFEPSTRWRANAGTNCRACRTDSGDLCGRHIRQKGIFDRRDGHFRNVQGLGQSGAAELKPEWLGRLIGKPDRVK